MLETWVQTLGQEDPMGKKMASHSRLPIWENPIDRKAWWATVHGGHKESDTT